jgi:hypothetical protein
LVSFLAIAGYIFLYPKIQPHTAASELVDRPGALQAQGLRPGVEVSSRSGSFRIRHRFFAGFDAKEGVWGEEAGDDAADGATPGQPGAKKTALMAVNGHEGGLR